MINVFNDARRSMLLGLDCGRLRNHSAANTETVYIILCSLAVNKNNIKEKLKIYTGKSNVPHGISACTRNSYQQENKEFCPEEHQGCNTPIILRKVHTLSPAIILFF